MCVSGDVAKDLMSSIGVELPQLQPQRSAHIAVAERGEGEAGLT